ncbi:hypothetical protein PDIDSM_3777 [Penicillium digitatum]|nr:hypothetical protein PDIDSM_3777 [Penicillium digitatum]
MDHERVIRDLFPALVVQLDRETSSTPSSESDDSAAVTHESPTPRVANTLRSSVAPRMGFDIDPSTSQERTSIHFFPQQTTGNDSDRELATTVPSPPSLLFGLEDKASNSPSNLSLDPPQWDTRSRQTTTPVPSTPIRSTRVRFAPVGGNSEEFLPTSSHCISSRDTPCASSLARHPQSTNTCSTNAGGRAAEVTPIATPKSRLVLKKRLREVTLNSGTTSDSTNAKECPKDVTPIVSPRIRIIVNKRPREDSPDSNIPSRAPRQTATDSASSKGRSKGVIPTVTPVRVGLFFKQRPRQSTLDPIPSTDPSGPASSKRSSYSAKPRNQSSNCDSDRLLPAENTLVGSSFISKSNMNPPELSARSISYGSSFDYETSNSINPTSELPATSESPKPCSSSDEAPSRDTGNPSPALDFVPATPPNPAVNPSIDPSMDPSRDPYVDPYQPSNTAVMLGFTPFEDPNVLPSTFMYPEETPDYSDLTIDPMGVYTPEEYARILASEQDVLCELADPPTDTLTHMYAREEEPHYTTLADVERNLTEIEAVNATIDILQPEYWAAIGRHKPGPLQPGAVESDQIIYAQSAFETLQSLAEADPGSATKRARHSLYKTKSSTPEQSTAVSARASASTQRRSTSSKTKSATPPSTSTCRRSKKQPVTPAPTLALSRRRSKTKVKAEIATPEAQISFSPRRLRSSSIMPSSNAKKNPKGNATPESWETASIADKMMSQMKETMSISWMDITTAWNENRTDTDDEMTWRALSKRWGRIKDKIGPWPGFDEALLDTLGGLDSELDDQDFAQIAEDVSTELGWEVSGAACQVGYRALKESGKVNLKDKRRVQK